VTIPVDAETADLLADPRKREEAGQLLTLWLRPKPETDPLPLAIARMKAQAHASGLTDEMIDDELTEYNSERRG
jgi:hypothetical protein